MREIEELLALCQYSGSVLVAQGAGGNASVKRYADEVMWIKASGYRLSELQKDYGYLKMRLPDVGKFAVSLAALPPGEQGSTTAIFSVTEWATLSFSFLARDSATPSLSSFSLMASVFF